MGKAHAIALKSVGTVFNTSLRPVCEMIATTSAAGAAAKARALGFNRSTDDWRELVADPQVEAIVIASPQRTHREIALASFAAGKPVFCEKPLGATLDDARAMTAAAERSGLAHMTGFNYIRTPASQLAHEMITAGEIGKILYVRAEHTEDFLADPADPSDWRTRDAAAGTMGDLSPHIINAVLRLAGPIESVVADIQNIYSTRDGPNGPEPVVNDDQAHFLCRLAKGAMGSFLISRIANGRKMGYAYEITGTLGALRFDQEDQNALWHYDARARRGRQGFTKLITGPHHPDYAAFCDGAGHGTGYNDQIIIEARDFLKAIETGKPVFPTFRDGLAVATVVAAVQRSHEERKWIRVSDI
jgi:predicted dehydrogenase